MFGDINLDNLKPKRPQLFLCKPNMTTIAKLNEAYGITHTTRLADLSEITFKIPYNVEIRKENQVNPNIEKIRERFLIKVKMGNDIEYYLINSITDTSDESKEEKTIKATSLGYQLRDKMINSYNEIGITAKQAVSDALIEMNWSIGKNLSDDMNYFNTASSIGGAGGRSFDVSSKTVLDFIIEIAEAFNAVIIWDTENKTIDFEVPENVGENKGLKISYGKYLQSLSKESNTDEMVTRLTPIGSDGLTIHSQNPTGTGFLEDFSFFMYPFQRDEFGNVAKSSNYMSDSLCNAILDYQNKIEFNKDKFSNLLQSNSDKQEEETQLENDLFNLQTELYAINDILTAKKSVQEHQVLDVKQDTVQDTSVDIKQSVQHSQNADYIVMAYLNAPTQNTLLTDGVQIATLPVNTWTIVNKKPTGSTETVFEYIGKDTLDVKFVVCSITKDEYDNTDGSITNDFLINKYNDYKKQSEVDAKQTEVDAKQAEIDAVGSQIGDLQVELSIETNFTAQQIVERNEYIIEKVIQNDSLISTKDLYDYGVKEFENIREPQVVMNIDVVNFLEVLDAWRDWDKLSLGDTIKIAHENLGVEMSAKIIEVEFDYDNGKIKLTIANVKDIKTNEDKLIDALYGAVSTSTTVESSKFKWDKVESVNKDVDSILNEPWDVTKRMIQSADGTVVWDRGGFKIISKTNPKEFLVATSGVLAITRSGGETWEHAITTQGIIGERIIGKLMVSENLIVENSSGTFTADKDGVTVTGTSLKIVGVDGSSTTIDDKFVEQKSYTDQLRDDIAGEISDVQSSVSDLDTEINTTFKDGIIDDAEKKAIAEHLKQLANEKSDVDGRYTNVSNNPYLMDAVAVGNTPAVTDKAELISAKTDFDTSYNNLVNAINTAIADSSVIDSERSNVDSKFTAYKVSIGNLGTAFEKAIDNIAKNKAVEAQNNSNAYTDSVKATIDQNISDVNNDITALNTYVDNSFRDGVINEAEATTIAEHINTLNSEKTNIDNRYNEIYTNPDLKDSVAVGSNPAITDKADLATAKTNYDTAHSDLINAINTAIADNSIIDAEKTNVDSKFTAYSTRLGQLSTAFENAINNISENKKKSAMSYADSLKSLVDQDISDVNTRVTSLNTYVDESFHDGVIDEAEATAISKYINSLNVEKADVDNRYNIIYSNTYLKTATVKTALGTAKTNLDSSQTALINSINTAIADGTATSAETADVDSKFADYKTKLGLLSTAFENAIDDISKNKTYELTKYDNSFEQGKDFWSDSFVGKDVAVTTKGTIVSGAGSIGGNVFQITGESWIFSKYAIPVDVTRTYKMKFRVKQTVDATSGGSNVYAGVATLDKDYNNLTGGIGTHRYFACSAVTVKVADGWKEYTGTISGVGDLVNNFRSGTVYVRPMFIVNYQTGNGTIQVDSITFDDITETLDGKSAWGKFSGAGNTLPSGSVTFGNGLTSSVIEQATLNFNNRNDRNSTTPNNPVVGATVGGATVSELDNTINTDGSSNISFEWDFDTNGNAGDIDGFILYIMQSVSSSAYSFGTSPATETVYYISPEKRAFILYGVPANMYYTFGIQAYRIVDKDINVSGVIKSSIIQSTKTGNNPYRPSSSVSFNGDITGTIAGTPSTTVRDKANNSLQSGTAYNNVTIDTTSGLVATRNDNIIRTVLNATNGIAVQKYESGSWTNKFFADTNGVLTAKGLVIESDDGTSVMIDAKNKLIDFSKFTTITGKLNANNITVGSSSTFEAGYNPTDIMTNVDMINKVPQGGIFTGSFTKNAQFDGTANDGELQVMSGTLIHPNGSQYTISGSKEIDTALEGTTASGYRYIMFVGSDFSRFTGIGANCSNQFIACTCENGVWKYDNNSTLTYFSTNENDCVVARIEKDSGTTGINRLIIYSTKKSGVYIDNTGLYTGTLKTDQLVAGTAKITTALIEQLIVGTNVSMGANASISWSNINGKPNTTYIDANGLYTGTVSASNVTAGTFTTGSTSYMNVGNGMLNVVDPSSSGSIKLEGATISVYDTSHADEFTTLKRSGANFEINSFSQMYSATITLSTETVIANANMTVNGSVSASSGYSHVGRSPSYTWSGTLTGGGGSAYIYHYLGYYPIVTFSGNLGNLILTSTNIDSNTLKVENYNTGNNSWSGTVYIW